MIETAEEHKSRSAAFTEEKEAMSCSGKHCPHSHGSSTAPQKIGSSGCSGGSLLCNGTAVVPIG